MLGYRRKDLTVRLHVRSSDAAKRCIARLGGAVVYYVNEMQNSRKFGAIPIFQFTFREDGSSKFGSDNRYRLLTNIIRILGLFYNIKVGNPLLLSKLKVINQ